MNTIEKGQGDGTLRVQVCQPLVLNAPIFFYHIFHRLIFYTAQGDKYIGNMKHGKAHGYGKKTFHNGSIYTGQFYRDVYHGQGYFLHVGEDGSNSRAYKGTWNKGEFVDGEVTMWGKGGKVEKKYSFMRLV